MEYDVVRVMCEDLGGTYDMDFNDIVYDIKYDKLHICTITVQAAGGTLPIRMQYGNEVLTKNISGEDLSEIHAIYGENLIPINVEAGTGVDNKGTVSWTIAFQGAQDDHVIRDGVLRVDYDWRNNEQYSSLLLDNINVYKYDEEAKWVSVANISGTAPFKIAVPNTTKWMLEEENIINGYPLFSDWVNDPTVKFWDPEVNTNKGKQINTSVLYQKVDENNNAQ